MLLRLNDREWLNLDNIVRFEYHAATPGDQCDSDYYLLYTLLSSGIQVNAPLKVEVIRRYIRAKELQER